MAFNSWAYRPSGFQNWVQTYALKPFTVMKATGLVIKGNSIKIQRILNHYNEILHRKGNQTICPILVQNFIIYFRQVNQSNFHCSKKDIQCSTIQSGVLVKFPELFSEPFLEF